MPGIDWQTLSVSSPDASSTTMISMSRPALLALLIAFGSRCGRLCVAMMTLTLGMNVFECEGIESAGFKKKCLAFHTSECLRSVTFQKSGFHDQVLRKFFIRAGAQNA